MNPNIESELARIKFGEEMRGVVFHIEKGLITRITREFAHDPTPPMAYKVLNVVTRGEMQTRIADAYDAWGKQDNLLLWFFANTLDSLHHLKMTSCDGVVLMIGSDHFYAAASPQQDANTRTDQISSGVDIDIPRDSNEAFQTRLDQIKKQHNIQSSSSCSSHSHTHSHTTTMSSSSSSSSSSSIRVKRETLNDDDIKPIKEAIGGQASNFSKWLPLFNPSEFERLDDFADYLPNFDTAGLFELAVTWKVGEKKAFFLGHTVDLRTRLLEINKDGSYLREFIQACQGAALLVRWSAVKPVVDPDSGLSINTHADATKVLLSLYDYAMNKRNNGQKRPSDIWSFGPTYVAPAPTEPTKPARTLRETVDDAAVVANKFTAWSKLNTSAFGLHTSWLVPADCDVPPFDTTGVFELAVQSSEGSLQRAFFLGHSRDIRGRLLAFRSNGQHLREFIIGCPDASLWSRWAPFEDHAVAGKLLLDQYDYALNKINNGKTRNGAIELLLAQDVIAHQTNVEAQDELDVEIQALLVEAENLSVENIRKLTSLAVSLRREM